MHLIYNNWWKSRIDVTMKVKCLKDYFYFVLMKIWSFRCYLWINGHTIEYLSLICESVDIPLSYQPDWGAENASYGNETCVQIHNCMQVILIEHFCTLWYLLWVIDQRLRKYPSTNRSQLVPSTANLFHDVRKDIYWQWNAPYYRRYMDDALVTFRVAGLFQISNLRLNLEARSSLFRG